jgi:ATP-dependent Lhr-like helicase
MTLRRLAADGRVAEGEFTVPESPGHGAGGSQWCDAEVLRLLRRRCLARLRKEVEPVPPEALGRFLPAWHGIEPSEVPAGGTGAGPSGGRASGGQRGGRRRYADAGAVLEAVERLAGAPVPASALETLVLPGRVPGYLPAMLDELTVAGEVVWAGAGSVGSGDGWLVLAPAESAPVLLASPEELTMTPLHEAVLAALDGGGGLFFRAISDRVAGLAGGHPPDDGELVSALWDLVWAGLVTNDTLAPLRVLLAGGGQPRRPGGGSAAGAGETGSGLAIGPGSGAAGRLTNTPAGFGASRAVAGGVFNPRPAGRGYGSAGYGRGGYGRRPAYGSGTRRPAMPSRTGPPSVSGRWSLLPERVGVAGGADLPGAAEGAAGAAATMRAHALALTLLERHGIVTRGAVAAERVPGGFAAVYPVLRAMEETGQCRRGYFIEGLGAAQFALPGAVDRMRALAGDLVTPRPAGPAIPDPAEWETPAEWSVPPQSGGPQGPGRPAGRNQPPGRRVPSVRPVVLAAADPAQPYGAALPWPQRPDDSATGHKPGRKAGALVIVANGALVLYVERGGKTLLSWTDEPEVLEPCAAALATAVREGALGRITVEKTDGETIHDTPLARALQSAGFRPTPRGLRLRG